MSPIIWKSHSRPIVFLEMNYNKQKLMVQACINGGMLKQRISSGQESGTTKEIEAQKPAEKKIIEFILG